MKYRIVTQRFYYLEKDVYFIQERRRFVKEWWVYVMKYHDEIKASLPICFETIEKAKEYIEELNKPKTNVVWES